MHCDSYKEGRSNRFYRWIGDLKENEGVVIQDCSLVVRSGGRLFVGALLVATSNFQTFKLQAEIRVQCLQSTNNAPFKSRKLTLAQSGLKNTLIHSLT